MSALSAMEMTLKARSMRPSICSCEACQARCADFMCVGTPDDILNLIQRGYAGFMDVMTVHVIIEGEHVSISMVQLMADDEGCVMFQDGKCLLHDTGLKPTEGKLYLHPRDPNEEDLMYFMALGVAMEWRNPKNMATAMLCFTKLLLNHIRP